MLIPKTVLSNVIHAAMSQGASFCEIYAEENLSSLMSLNSSDVEYLSGKDTGAGIRLFYGNKEFYTYSNSLDEKSLLQALKFLLDNKQNNSNIKPVQHEDSFTQTSLQTYPKKYLTCLKKEKALLQKLDKYIRAQSSSISQCYLNIKRLVKQVQIANSEGLLSLEFRPYFTFAASSIAEDKNQKEQGSHRIGLTGYVEFLNEDLLQDTCSKSVQEALQNIQADFAPSGRFPVIINKGFGGVIFHEACGHGMETTSVAEKLSVFSDKQNCTIAKPCVTAYDDGTLEGTYGYIAKDDEGQVSQKTCLIEKGVLKNYMVDKLGSQKTGYKMTGSGRRENYKYPPTSRMRNTYIAPGTSSLDSMIKDVEYGIFAETLVGGSVEPTTGNYNFTVNSARLIKNGRLDKAIKGASLIGDGLDTLSKIEKVGTDLELSPGTCGSLSGLVPVTVGQPHILVSELTVGGQK